MLFQIQPLISKAILPWFGGTPGVWTTCLLFFQSVLFGGYLYAHWLIEKLKPRWQAIVHSGLLLAACLTLTILPGNNWKPTGEEQPVVRILLVLLVTVGLPYFVLSTTGPLLQAWFGRLYPNTSPYRLYALSNVGSLLALISYPFVFEPALGLSTQALFWTLGFLGLAVLCATCGWVAALRRNPSNEIVAPVREEPSPAEEPPPQTGGRWWQWFVLSMTASVMLLATTNQVCQDVAVVPFLWVVPLSLYLLTFILCFDGERWYSRIGFGLAGAFSAGWAAFLMISPEGFDFLVQVVIYFTALFTTGMVCHGELARLKPEPARLTAFYLTLAAGGAMGGIFVGVVAPLIFPLFFEMHLALALCVVLSVGVYFHEARQRERVHNFHKFAILCSAVGTLGIVFLLGKDVWELLGSSSQVERNFYGVIRLKEINADDPELHKKRLLHGRILHGFQFQSPKKSMWATTYYGPDSGVGRTFQVLQNERPKLKVGVVGLGTGTLSAYGREGDAFRFYEINEAIVRIAQNEFTFVKQSPAQTEIILGDARLQLEREADQKFDLLILDAFSGDSIPAHLLSTEAMEIYERHLAKDGVLAIHISNLHFDLAPVVVALAEASGFQSRLTSGHSDEETGQSANYWFIASRDGAIIDDEVYADLQWDMPERRILWTDDFSNLFSVLK